MKRYMTTGAIILIILMSFGCGPKNEAYEAQAKVVADAWVALVDAGDYGETYDQAAESFKAFGGREKWIEALTQTRKPLGKHISREVKSISYKTSLEGSPKGHYVVVKYRTKFENKLVDEYVTPKLETDGKWRVAGYHFKKKWTDFW